MYLGRGVADLAKLETEDERQEGSTRPGQNARVFPINIDPTLPPTGSPGSHRPALPRRSAERRGLSRLVSEEAREKVEGSIGEMAETKRGQRMRILTRPTSALPASPSTNYRKSMSINYQAHLDEQEMRREG